MEGRNGEAENKIPAVKSFQCCHRFHYGCCSVASWSSEGVLFVRFPVDYYYSIDTVIHSLVINPNPITLHYVVVKSRLEDGIKIIS